ncbi:MAG TPA: hypothetical protein DCM05_07785 [Elusimicrobia bacterium]|nr:hypothetical protein [Elusimicrobiota bacterium]
MRTRFGLLAVGLLGLLAFSAAAEEVLSISALLKDRKGHNGKNVCIAGKTSVLFEKFSRKGNHYYSVWVDDGSGKIKVFSFGYPSFKQGDEIEACGQYLMEKWQSGRVFHDELTAKVILTGASMRSSRVAISSMGVVALDAPPEKAPKR